MLNQGQLKEGGLNEHTLQKLGWQTMNLPLETANAFQNFFMVSAAHQPNLIDEMIKVLEVLKERPGRIKDFTDIKVDQSRKKRSGPIVVIGSGSSLNEVAPTLKDWPGAVICSTSQASTLVKLGRPPDYVACLDPRNAPQDELAAEDWGDSVLLGHVSIPAAYITKWLRRARGTAYLGRIMEPNYDWYSHHLGFAYPWIRHVMLPMIDSSACEIAMATWMGYNPIYLVGVDYGGPRFNRWDWHYDTKEWTIDADTSGLVASAPGAVHTMTYSSRGTLLSAFMQIANEKYHQKIYNLSDRSQIHAFPRAYWKDGAVESEETFDRAAVMEDIGASLAVWDTFMVPCNNGFGVDYMTYICKDERQLNLSLEQFNQQLLDNLSHFDRVEKQFGKTLQELIAEGIVHAEAGDLLLHGAEEFGGWDWHKMRPVDIPTVLLHRRHLLAVAAERGYTRGEAHKLNEVVTGEMREMKAGDEVTPDNQQTIDIFKEAGKRLGLNE